MIPSILVLTTLIIILSLLLPWWIIAIVAFIYTTLKSQNSLWKSIVVAFISGCLAYLIYSLFTSIGTERSSAEMIANLFGKLPSWSAYVVSALIGGIISAFGGLSGHLGNKIVIGNSNYAVKDTNSK